MDTHVEDMITNPTRHFDHPADVLNEPTLTNDDKRRILESWQLDAQRLAESTAENMSGGEETDLRDVSKVLVQLKSMDDAPVARQPDRSSTRGVGAGLALGGIVGAGAGLLINTVIGASLAVVAQAAVVGVIIGGVGVTLRNAVRK
ncbi:MAG TPA: hypothetical protein VGO52_14220 [Hyphomonadaceae bacterium]|jgi:hypothetical protein|nr:hypothetical protein [Hyphomonadaceae bacterium]